MKDSRLTSPASLLVLTFLLFFSTLSAQTVTKTNAVGGQIDGQVVPKTVVFSAADFPTSQTVVDVQVNVQFRMVDVACPSGSAGFNEESCFWLLSPSGTKVVLTYDAYNTHGRGITIPPSYNGFASVFASLDFDDAAATLVGGTDPVSGTFRPVEPLSVLTGENAVGTWTLQVADGNPGFPMCFSQMSITVNTMPIAASNYIFVDSTATGADDGTSWADAFNDLQDALGIAGGGDTILVAQGTYFPDEASPTSRNLSFTLVDSAVMLGGFPSGGAPVGTQNASLYPTRLSGNIGVGPADSYHVLQGSGLSDRTVVEGFAIISGNAGGAPIPSGGGLLLLGGSEVVFKQCLFANNQGVTSGGAVHSIGNGNPYFKACRFQGNNANRGGAASVDVGDLFFEGCIFENNVAGAVLNGGGALIAETGGKITVRGGRFSNNNATFGGACLALNTGSLDLKGVKFENNSANDTGGAIGGNNGANVLVDSCDFIGNYTTSNDGGAIGMATGGRLIVKNSTFNANFATFSGGAIYASLPAKLDIVNSLFSFNNVSGRGGAVFVLGGTGTIVNSGFAENRATTRGGALSFDANSLFDISNCTIARDTCLSGGGGIAAEGSAVLNLTNSILWENGSDQIFTGGTALVNVYRSDVQGGYPGIMVINSDPLFVFPDTLNYGLQNGSPAIDFADDLLLTPDSLDVDGDFDYLEPTPAVGGTPRIIGSHADLGAFESAFTGPACVASASCHDTTIYLGATGTTYVDPYMVDAGSFSTCLIDSIWTSLDSVSCADLGTRSITLFVRDTSGVIDSCTSNLTIEDTLPPVAVCQDITVYLDNSGNTSITPTQVDGGSFDNCAAIPSLVFPDFFNCSQAGSNLVTLHVADPSTNSANCMATVTVVDTIPPVPQCPSDTILYLGPGGCTMPLPDLALIGTLPLANSSGDFSGTQGQTGWYYGFASSLSPVNFSPLPNFGGSWTGVETGGTPTLDQYGGFPGISSGNYPVRRWISSYTGTVDLVLGFFDRDTTCGDGADIRIFHNGTQVYQYLDIPHASTSDLFALPVTAGDTLDFIIDPRSTSDCDDTYFTATVTAPAPLQVTDNCLLDTIFSHPAVGTTLYPGVTGVDIFVVDNFGNSDSCSLDVNVVDTLSPVAVCATGPSMLEQEQLVVDNTTSNIAEGYSQGIIPTISGNLDSIQVQLRHTVGATVLVELVGSNNPGIGPVLASATLPVGTTLATHSVVFSPAPPVVVGNEVQLRVTDQGATGDVIAAFGTGVGFPGDLWSNTGFGWVGPSSIFDMYLRTFVSGGPVFYLDSTGMVVVTPSDMDGGSFDNCTLDSVYINVDTFTCADLGQHAVTLTVIDSSGNMGTCTTQISIEDSIPGEITACPSNLVEFNTPGRCDGMAFWTPPVAYDNCGLLGQGSSHMPGDTFLVDTTEVIYWADFLDGSSDTCRFEVVVQDIEPPVLSGCPGSIVVPSDSGICGAVVNWLPPGVFDNCTATISSTHNSGTVFPVGVTSVLYTATDPGGNIDTCGFAITVVDSTAPELICPADFSVSTDTNTCDAIVNFAPAFVNDACGLQSVTSSMTSGVTYPKGVHNVVFMAQDSAGNMSSCSFNFTVVDSVQPRILCPANLVVNNDTSFCGAVVTYSMPTATDNCDVPAISQTIGGGSGSFFSQGIHSQTFMAVDSSGNTESCTFTIQVVDTENPEITCPADTVLSTIAGSCNAPYSFAPPGATDNCSGVSVIQTTGLTSGALFPQGITTQAFEAIDVNGNLDSCTWVVEVRDLESPVIVCPNDTTLSSDPGVCSAIYGFLPPAASDNCTIDTLYQFAGPASGSAFPLGSTTIAWEVFDQAGNQDSCSFVLTVEDQEAPTVNCLNPTEYLPGSGILTLSLTDFDGGLSDNCGPVDSVWVSQLNFDCDDVGVNQDTLFARDQAGNIGFCVSSVTVIDSVQPVAVCTDITLHLDNSGNATLTPAQIDGGSTDNCGVDSTMISPPNFDCNSIGTNAVTLTVYDKWGNSSSCNSIVTVLDTVAPAMNCLTMNVELDSTGVYNINPALVSVGSFDACGIDSLTLSVSQFTCADVGLQTVLVSGTDSSGNTGTCLSNLTVEDNQLPTAICRQITRNLNGAGFLTITPADIDDGSFDNCQIDSMWLSQDTFMCAETGFNSVTLTVQDEHGNQSVCSTGVIVQDATPPTFVNCPPLQILVVDSLNCSTPVTWTEPTWFDNCGVETFFQNHYPGDTFSVGGTQVFYSATDTAGNNTLCIFNIIIQPKQFNISLSSPTYACGNNISCGGASDGSAAVEVSGGCWPYTYSWSTGDTTSSISGLGPGWYTVTVSDGRGAVLTDSVQLIEPAPLQAQFFGNLTLCTFDTTGILDLTVSGGNSCAPLSFAWTNGDTTEDLIDVPSGVYGVTVTDIFGCTDGDTVTLSIFPPAQVDIGADTSICPGEVGILDGQPGFFSYLWSTGDSTRFLDAASPGDYSVYVVDSNGCDDRDTLSVDFLNPPVPELGADTTLCAGDSLLLDPGVFNTYLWSPGGTAPTLTVDTTSTIWVEVVDSTTCTGRDTIQIGIYNVASANPVAQGPATICLGDTIQLVADPGFSSYLWSDGAMTRTTSVDTGGFFYVTVSDSSGCFRTDSVEVTYIPVPDPEPVIAPSGPVYMCDGEDVMLDAGSGFSQYEWNTGATTQQITAATEGWYYVRVWNSSGCSEVSDSVFTDSVPSPSVNITVSGDTMTANPPGASYQWYYSGAIIGGATNRTYVSNRNGVFRVEVTDANGCTGSDTIDFVVGIEGLAAEYGLEIYPNPTSGQLNLRTYRPIVSELRVEILDMHGRKLKTFVHQGLDDLTSYSLTDLANGMYVIKVQTDRGTWTRRFMIE